MKTKYLCLILIALCSQAQALQISFMGNEKTSKEIPVAGAEETPGDGDHLFTKNVQIITETREVLKGKCSNNKPVVVVFKNGDWTSETPTTVNGGGRPAADVAFEACGEKVPVSKIYIDPAAAKQNPGSKSTSPPPPPLTPESQEDNSEQSSNGKNSFGCDTIVTTPIACMEKAAKSFKGN